MGSAFDRIKEGLEEAIQHAKGEKRLHEWVHTGFGFRCHVCGKLRGSRMTGAQCFGRPASDTVEK